MREHQHDEETFGKPHMPPPGIGRSHPERRPPQKERESAEPGSDRGSERDGRSSQLFSAQDRGEYRSRWDSIQTGFVDEPRSSVEQADQLVAQVVERVTETFTRERERLEKQWARGDDVSTEDLRVAMKRYHTFFDRLLEM